MITLESLPSPVLDHSALVGMLHEYARPNDKISELIAAQALVPLKRGLYLITSSKQAAKELIANHLHGPSYVSRQWALAYYGLVSERVSVVTSMCLGRSRQIETRRGVFHYQAVPPAYYAAGICSIQQSKIAFMMASPEKALADWLVSTRHLRIQSTSAMHTFLEDDLRLNKDDLTQLDTAQLSCFAKLGYKATMLSCLARTIEQFAHD